MEKLLSPLVSIATIAGAAVAVYSAWDSRQSTRKQEREGEKQRLETKRQAAIAAELLHTRHVEARRAWVNDVIDMMGRAISLCRSDDTLFPGNDLLREREHIAMHLSSLLDKGRLLFPNYAHETYGAKKPPANRGFREPILEFIFEGYAEVAALERLPDPRRADAIFEIRRNFVGHAQEELDPRQQQARLKAVLGDALTQTD
ncbi:hypothetical protein IHV25_09460 [Phaeovibrio sulfidiphilus]|uniref:Uncharacterized protein n=1 Tax=Phaeovibrio sulfidiphilus TaxID=1220600 RepID=A0A8J6YQC2_9PROT|nr:hypothetical protein [Phaeovibrio sulfidiphilus]MBE1237869.1 hypothetical protein [Phaeovibrio sulfidiphilus]